jgi:hypothetical protein
MLNFDLNQAKDDIQYGNKNFIKFNDLKWLNYILISMCLIQLVFFLGYTFISLMIFLQSILISYKIYKICKEAKLGLDVDYSHIISTINSTCFYLKVCVVLCTFDILISLFTANEFILSLLQGQENFGKKFAVFTIFLIIFRFGFLLYFTWFLQGFLEENFEKSFIFGNTFKE